MKAIQYIRLIGKEFISLTDAELHLWVEMVRPRPKPLEAPASRLR